MKSISFVQFLLFSFIILSCSVEDEILKPKENEQNNMEINGFYGKALYIAINDFYTYDYPMEKYRIVASESTDFYFIIFLPEILNYETADYGHQDFGSSVTYWISKENYKIEKKYLGR